MDKLKQIKIFIGLKLAEITGFFLLTFGSYLLGKYINELLNLFFTNWFGLWNIGFFTAVVLLLILSLIVWIIIIWIRANWNLAGRLSK